MLRTDDLDYHLPESLIATRPHEPRDESRLLVLSRSDPTRREDRRFRELPELLEAGDTLIFNTTSVIPARFNAMRADTGGKASGLFIHDEPDGRWRVMIKSSTKLRPNTVLTLATPAGEPTHHSLTLIEKLDDQWRIDPSPGLDLSTLDELGETPLPPYILGARKQSGDAVDDELDRAWYQTVYADPSRAGSVAAPTAGLHFTPRLLDELASSGVRRADISLDVGPGTFKPVQTDTLDDHPMHTERFVIPPETIDTLRAPNTRHIPVGTTSVRALESLPDPLPSGDRPFEAETDLLIAQGFDFRHTDGLITNFHLPRSTLMALVAALLPGGVQQLKNAYAHAVERRYRFYSYGDAMLILP